MAQGSNTEGQRGGGGALSRNNGERNVEKQGVWANRPIRRNIRNSYARILSISKGAKVDPRGIRCFFLGYVHTSQAISLLCDLQHRRQIQSRDVRFIEGQSPMHEEFINLPNRLVQLVIPAPDNAEIHMDPISIDDDEYEGSSDDMEFDKASLLTPIVDDKHLGQSGQEPHTRSDSHITSDVASDASSADEDIGSAQRMDIDAPHTRIPGTPYKRETDPTIDDLTTSSSAIRHPQR
jgi:hypothetical protein